MERPVEFDGRNLAVPDDAADYDLRLWGELQQTASKLRDRMLANGSVTERHRRGDLPRVVNYLSMEFLMGRLLNNGIHNLDLQVSEENILSNHTATLEDWESVEPDPGLGNGGLGRLAACFLDSCASLDIPVVGYGIRYRFGMFEQAIRDGYQLERPDEWLARGPLWEKVAMVERYRINFGGRCVHHTNDDGGFWVEWVDTHQVEALAYDIPIPGYRNGVTNILRLWRAQAVEGFDLQAFNRGDYSRALHSLNDAECISAVLYPDDSTSAGRELRLRQQYFLASATLQDVLARWLSRSDGSITNFADGNVFQLNDTHPIVAIPELMRLLMDEYRLSWDTAWSITTRCMAYTNHTLLPEALETWPLELMDQLVPRISEIIREIDRRWNERLKAEGVFSREQRMRMAIIAYEPNQLVRMANLGVVACYSVNGVAALHTKLLREGLFKDFCQLEPQKFNNKTNGVTPRRWLAFCNPGLSDLITETVGDGWQTDLDRLSALAPLADDTGFAERFMAVKRTNKARLAEMVWRETGVLFDADNMMFDVQVKRIHEYKRQVLNLLHVVHLYNRIRKGDVAGMVPRCVLIGGKAAAGYAFAKRTIKFANDIAKTVNNDPLAKDWLRVVFLPNYRVSSMEVICPGTDLSEQISTAGKEASGTGNMKFMMNGAVTIGTLDGANIEIREAAGADNFFMFGMSAAQVAELRPDYEPQIFVDADSRLTETLALISSGVFNVQQRDIASDVLSAVWSPNEPWLTLADFTDYVRAQEEVARAWSDPLRWARMAILNTAMSGRFSSDRTIREYRDDIWFRDVLAL